MKLHSAEATLEKKNKKKPDDPFVSRKLIFVKMFPVMPSHGGR